MSVNMQTERLIMKKWILTATALGLVVIGTQSARAGDREWATVGKVLTGVAAGVVIANALDSHPTYASVSYGYASPGYSVRCTVSTPPPCPPPPPVFAAPAPVVYQPAPVVYAPARVVYQPPVVVAPPRVVYAPVPVCHVSHNHPGRGHAYGHGNWRR